MAMKQCPICGEKYSDTYKKCPFCEEEKAMKEGKRLRRNTRGGKRSVQKSPNLLTPMLVILILIMAALLVYLLFGERFAKLPGIEKQPEKPVEEVQPEQPEIPDVQEPVQGEDPSDPTPETPTEPETPATTTPVAPPVTSNAEYEAAEKLPEGLNVIFGALAIAPLARILAITVDPAVNMILGEIGSAISAAAEQSPLVMGFLLGGIMKMICTSPLSSMALTAMLGLTGLPMGIAAIACVGGSFTNGIIFHKLGFGNKGNVIAVMLEPLTQADIITANPIPIFGSNFLGGGLAGVAAAVFGIVNNAPGTASPIPGLLAPFAFNNPMNVILALVFAALGGSVAGLLGAWIFGKHTKETRIATSGSQPGVLIA